VRRFAWWGVTRSSEITVRPHPGLGSERARDIRARAWAFVFDCYEKKKAAGVIGTNGGDGKEIKDVPANPILPERE
jgi:hypothetical protein